ncbi:meiotically up-regulated gene 184 protein [Senna tora]|uniref:Meiotically up-regulated gene 184 protein n=1 Tax=Senna tora TaxID=362788 RepID=A0A834WKW8_9FABA|nr:meiotically up-regulated gene 184 protein [Senna tora]
MECNKDEATRAKEIAERKFVAKDILGAKKFALKAQNLFPDLDGIPQMLATLDVYISAENKINGEADWYGILGVDPRADDETVRKHYRKLALTLHPDKNKSIGADGAFKFISEAWSLLSDKAKRASYDQKRKTKAQKVPMKSGGTSVHPGANGNYNFSKTATSSARAHKSTTKAQASTSTHKSKTNTFWTVCHRCKMQYEYLRVYLNLKLLCPNCHEAFLAVETAPPPANGVRPATSWNFSQQQQNFKNQAPNKNKSSAGKNKMIPNVGAGCYSNTDVYNSTDFQWAPFSRTSGVSTAAQAATVVQQAYEKVKREREEAQAATKREQALQRKQHVSKKGHINPAKRRRGMDDASISSHGKEPGTQMRMRNGEVGAANSCGSKQGSFGLSGISKTSSSIYSIVEHNYQLVKIAREEIDKKLKEIQSNTVAKTAMEESGNGYQKANEEGEESGNGYQKANEEGEKYLRNSETCDQNRMGKSEDERSGSHVIKTSAGTTDANMGMDMETLQTMSTDVPDPDFHDFGKDCTERSFGKNQIWAVYDDDDGMPRYYAMIHSVISLSPFKMRIRWLICNADRDRQPVKWAISGYSKICGDFRMGGYQIFNSINPFSHKVRWRKDTTLGAICIYPMKGDVWALFRNGSPDWNELTVDKVIHKYDIVEVLEDFSEKHGVIVIPLVKVAGFKTLFHRHLDPREIRVIPREEMFRFSHQIPSYLHTGKEAPNALRGCRELDPAATPSELLQVIKVVEEEDMVGMEDGIVEESARDNLKRSNDEDIITDTEKVSEGKVQNNKDIQEIEILEEDREEDKQQHVEWLKLNGSCKLKLLKSGRPGQKKLLY